MSAHDEQLLQHRIDRLVDALDLAVNHISWCWDRIEKNTLLSRDGSDDIHGRLSKLLADERLRKPQ